MHVAVRWSIIPILAVTGAVGLLAGASQVDMLDDVEAAEAPTQYVPIAGYILQDDGACLPFLAGLTARPQWTLQVADVATSCMGSRQLDRFEIHEDGIIAWRPRGLAERRLQLAPAQLERIRKLDTLSCAYPSRLGFADHDYQVGLGIFDGDRAANGGAHLSTHAPAGVALAEILDEAIATYNARRLAELGSIDIRLDVSEWGDVWTPSTAVYRVELKQDRLLRVWHGDKLVQTDTVTPRELVDTVDWATQTLGERAGRSRQLMFASGTLTVGSGTYPLALWQYDNYELVPYGRLYYAANAAPYLERKH